MVFGFSVLNLLGLLPGLITSVEGLFHAFPGSGSVKKQAVLSGVNGIATVANAAGAKIDVNALATVAGALIDDYVAVQNSLGTAGFAQAQAAANLVGIGGVQNQ